MPDQLYDVSADLNRALQANPQFGGSYIPFGGNPVHEQIANVIVQPLMPSDPTESQRYMSLGAERNLAAIRMSQRYQESAERQMGPYNAYQTLNEMGGGLIMGLGSAFGHPGVGLAAGIGSMMTNMPQNVAEWLGFAPPDAYRDDFTMESLTQTHMAESLHRAAWSTLDPLSTGRMRGVSGATARTGAENMQNFMQGYGYQGMELTRIMPALEQAGAFEGVGDFDEMISRAQNYIEQISAFIQRTRATIGESIGMAATGVSLGGNAGQVGAMMGATSVYTNAAGIPISNALQATEQLAQPFSGMAGDYTQLMTNYAVGTALTSSMAATDPNMASDQIWMRAGGAEGVEGMAQQWGVTAWQTPRMQTRAAAFAALGTEAQWNEYARTGAMPEGVMSDFENLGARERYRAYFEAGDWMAAHSNELVNPLVSDYLSEMPDEIEATDYQAVSGYLFRRSRGEIPTGVGYGLAQRHFLTTSPYANAEQFDAFQAGTVEARFQARQSRVEDAFTRSARRQLLRDEDISAPLGNLYDAISMKDNEQERAQDILNRRDILASDGANIRLADMTGTTYPDQSTAEDVATILDANNNWRMPAWRFGDDDKLVLGTNLPDLEFETFETDNGQYGVRATAGSMSELEGFAANYDLTGQNLLERYTMTGQGWAVANADLRARQRDQGVMPQMVTRAEIELMDSATRILRDDNQLQAEMTRSMAEDNSGWGNSALNYQLARDMTDAEPINPGSELLSLANAKIPFSTRFDNISSGSINSHMDLANTISQDLYGVSYADASREERASVGRVQGRFFRETEFGQPEEDALGAVARDLESSRSGIWGGNENYAALSETFTEAFTPEERTAILSYYTGESDELDSELALRFGGVVTGAGVVGNRENLRRFAAGQVLTPHLRGIEEYIIGQYDLEGQAGQIRELLSTGKGSLRGEFEEGSLAAQVQEAARSGGNISGEELQQIIERYLTEVAPETTGGKEAAKESSEYLREIAQRGAQKGNPMYVTVVGNISNALGGEGRSGAAGETPTGG